MSAATATVSRFAGVNRRALGLAIFYLILAAIIVVGFVPGTEPGDETTFILNLGATPLFLLPDLVVPAPNGRSSSRSPSSPSSSRSSPGPRRARR
jgi:hypothetical protein